MSEIKQVRKLTTYPAEVWEDVKNYVWEKYKLSTPKHNFKFSKFIHSRNFKYKRFIEEISEKRAMLLFLLICQKLGVGFIQDSSGWKIVAIEETADKLLEFCKHALVSLEEVKESESV